MEEIKVSEMLQADSINKDDSVMIIQEGVNKKASGSIQTATGTSLSLTSVADTCKVKSNSKNLFDGKIEQGGFNSGQPQDNTTRVRSSNFTKVNANTTYTASVPSDMKVIVLFYDASRSFISDTGEWANITKTFTTPANTNSLKLLIGKQSNSNVTPSEVSNVQLEEGSTATAYEPYNTEVKLNNSIYGGSFAVGDWMVTTGEPRVTSGRIRCAEKLQVEPNTEYIFDTELGDIIRFVLFYDENQAYLNTYIDIKANNGHFTTSATTKYITFYVISTEATIYDNYVIVEATKKASMQSIMLEPQEEKSAFTYDTTTNLTSDGSVTIEYNTKGRLLNNDDVLDIVEPVKKYVDTITNGTILYEDAIGSNTDISLNDDIVKYTKVDIEYYARSNANKYLSTIPLIPNSNTSSSLSIVLGTVTGGSEQTLYTTNIEINITNNNIAFGRPATIKITNGNIALTTTNGIYITKVIGYK